MTSVNARCAACPIGVVSAPCPWKESERPAGAVLVEEGAVPPRVWWLRRGVALLTSVAADGEERFCARRGPGSLIGLEALAGAAADYRAVALGAVAVCSLDAEAFARWIGDLQTPAGAVLELALGEAARRCEERVAVGGRAVARLARFLVERRAPDVPLQVLARMLAMRPETLSRALAELRTAGALAPGRRLEIADEARLAQIAGA